MRRRDLLWWSGCSLLIVAVLLMIQSLRRLERTFEVKNDAAVSEMRAIDDSQNLHSLLYQKGFAAHYILTGDEARLRDLTRAKVAFEAWLDDATDRARPEEVRPLVQLRNEYRRWDAARTEAIAEFQNGDRERAVRALLANPSRGQRIKELIDELLRIRQAEVAASQSRAEEM